MIAPVNTALLSGILDGFDKYSSLCLGWKTIQVFIFKVLENCLVILLLIMFICMWKHSESMDQLSLNDYDL